MLDFTILYIHIFLVNILCVWIRKLESNT